MDLAHDTRLSCMRPACRKLLITLPGCLRYHVDYLIAASSNAMIERQDLVLENEIGCPMVNTD